MQTVGPQTANHPGYGHGALKLESEFELALQVPGVAHIDANDLDPVVCAVLCVLRGTCAVCAALYVL